MSWFEQLAQQAGDVYSNTVNATGEYLNTRINDYTSDPETVQTATTGITPAPALDKNAGLFGFSWQTLAAMATVAGFLFMILRGR